MTFVFFLKAILLDFIVSLWGFSWIWHAFLRMSSIFFSFSWECLVFLMWFAHFLCIFFFYKSYINWLYYFFQGFAMNLFCFLENVWCVCLSLSLKLVCIPICCSLKYLELIVFNRHTYNYLHVHFQIHLTSWWLSQVFPPDFFMNGFAWKQTFQRLLQSMHAKKDCKIGFVCWCSTNSNLIIFSLDVLLYLSCCLFLFSCWYRTLLSVTCTVIICTKRRRRSVSFAGIDEWINIRLFIINRLETDAFVWSLIATNCLR